MSKKSFSYLSALFFVLSVFPLLAGLTRWGNGLYVYVLNINIYSPVIFGGIGLLFALFGMKGKVKIGLVLLNILALCLSLFLLFVAIYGFQEP
ncbi:hypothetical protein [Alkalihalobacillus sp. AL-G]|uniref:hypothetical protein n=1 Tax=Alkalihalobacillus sp. AL-G TaxID=2926399 RepID=UPI00272BA7E7|nr:hypothetical protein [Alkalihalobacillus sp. AL-G]WLD92482.1 hypothetical protein MOJ78_15900 [Alkalihalobacillus sp. AL-G]